MNKGIRLTRASFFTLYEKIREVHRNNYNEILDAEGYKVYRFPSGESDLYFGFSRVSDTAFWDLHTAMCSNKEVQSYLEHQNYVNSNVRGLGKYQLSAKKLYYLLADFKKNKERPTDTVFLRNQYEKVYFIYAGFRGVHDFIDKCLTGKNKDYQKALLTLGEREFSGYETEYKGYYYSFRHHVIKSFNLRVDYINDFLVEEKGLHANEPYAYTGKAEHQKDCLMMNLENRTGGFLSFIGYIGAQHPEKVNIINTTYQTISSISGHPIAREAVLIKKDQIDDKAELNITRYLMTQRRNYRIRPITYDKTWNLNPKGYRLDYLDHMIGNYVVWSLNRHNEVIQAQWILKRDHTSFLYSTVTKERQVCLLSMSGIGTRKLCVTSYVDDGIDIVNFALLDVPNRNTSFTYFNADFVTKGITGSVATFAVFMKVEEDHKPMIGKIQQKYLEILLKEERYKILNKKIFELVKQKQIPVLNQEHEISSP